MYNAARDVVLENVREGRLVPSNAPFASPVFFKPKKEPGVPPRMLCDFKTRNANTVKNANCVPTVDEITKLATGKYFAKFDLTNAFSQIRLDPKSQYLTAINTPWGCYEWKIMPQGLQNSPATWQSMINKHLADMIGTICFAYVDDVIVFGANTIQEHIERCEKVIERIGSAHLLINPLKSTLFAEKINMLGHIISEKGIEVNNDKVTQIVEWKTPVNKREVQRFMGLVNWIRNFFR